MSLTARLLALVAMALLAAQPVMACCLAGHAGTTAVAAAPASPPCHDAGMDMGAEANADAGATHGRGPAHCPGCLDCDSPVMQAQASDGGAILAGTRPDVPLALRAADFPGFATRPVVLKTGPPDAAPRRHETPLTLKQRLLI